MSKTITINQKTYLTYSSVGEADEYFAAKFGSEWSNVGDNQKPQLLISATRFIDLKDYRGEVVEEGQAQKFPRIIDGVETSEETLIIACCEIAESIYRNNGIDYNMDNIKSVSLGGSGISFKDGSVNESQQILDKYLSDYQLGSIRTIL